MLMKAENLFKMSYNPVVDTSQEIDPDAATYYLTIISIFKWMIESGRIDIITKVMLFSSHVATPRDGHLKVAVHVMAHVGQRYNSILLYDLCTQK